MGRRRRFSEYGYLNTSVRIFAIPYNSESSDCGSIFVWKAGSPQSGDVPDSTLPFELSREAKKIGFNLSIGAYPAKGFATKLFEAVDKHEEPDILVIDNYGIIDGITTPLGTFTGIGKSEVIRNSLILVTDSLKEFEGSQGGWEILISTSKNFQAAKSLALRQPTCGSESMVLEENKKFISEELNKSSWRYASDLYHVRPGSYLGITICGFWGDRNLAFLHLIVAFEGEKNIGSSNILLAMNKIGADWELLSKGSQVGIIPELTNNAGL
jgi:hypothetical protein